MSNIVNFNGKQQDIFDNFAADDILKLGQFLPKVSEVRLLGEEAKGGYFDDVSRILYYIKRIEANPSEVLTRSGKLPSAYYFMINGVSEDKLIVSDNVINLTKGLTKDSDVINRHMFFIDIDPVRPSGVSSTDDEKAAAYQMALDVKEHLDTFNFPAPVMVDSGNGYHLWYRLDMPNNDESTYLIKTLLEALANEFSNANAKVDASVFNAGRITKIPGTMARKGENTIERPHRISRFVSIPDSWDVVSVDLIKMVIAEHGGALAPASVVAPVNGVKLNPDESEQQRQDTINYMQRFIEMNGVAIRWDEPYKGNGHKWKLYQCPFCESVDEAAALFVQLDQEENKYKPGFGCHHDRCKSKHHWSDFKTKVEKQFLPDNADSMVAKICEGIEIIDLPEPINVPKPKVKPKIDVTGQQSACAEQAIAALLNQESDYEYYNYGEAVVRIPRKGELRQQDLDRNDIVSVMGKCADWIRPTKNGYTAAQIPVNVISSVVSELKDRLPELVNLKRTPYFTYDGQLINNNGYNPKTKHYLRNELSIDLDTEYDVEWARDLIMNDLFADFPFTGQADKANAVAMLLQPFMRDLYEGASPLYGISASIAGSGKTMIANLAYLIYTGRHAPKKDVPSNDEEWGKVIGATLIAGEPIIVFDNANQAIHSGKLASALTTTSYEHRVLCTSVVRTLPNFSTWIVTGNNLKTSGEIERRVIEIRLEPQVAKPHLRKDFKRPVLTRWVINNRASLVKACLVIIKNWLDKGRPQGSKFLGSYEEWTPTMSGVLEAAGINGFMDNYEDTELDEVGGEWEVLIEAWAKQKLGNEMNARELYSFLWKLHREDNVCFGVEFNKVLSQNNEVDGYTKLSYIMRSKVDVIIGDWKIVKGKGKRNYACWSLKKVA